LHSDTFEEVMDLGVIKRDVENFDMWVDELELGKYCFMDRYEDFYHDLQGLVLSIASVMDIRPTARTVMELAERFSFESNKARADIIGKSEEDLLFPGHLQTGKVGMWRDVLTKEQANRVVDIIGRDWFAEWGYE